MPPLTPDSKTYKAIGLLKQSQLKSVSLVEEIATGNRYVAHQLKTPSTLTKEAAATRLTQEAEALTRVTHPNVPRFMGYQTTATGNWFLFEYLDGYPLSQHKGDTDKVPDDWLMWWFWQIVVTVDQLHQNGVVIGGFEPKHFLVHGDKLYLVHVGILENLFPETLALLRSPDRLTFTAPEHRHSIHTSVTGDLYSAGALAFWLCTGKAPAFGTRVEEEQVRGAITQSRRDSAISTLICRLLQFQAAQRPQTAVEVVEALRTFTHDLTGGTPPAPVRPYKVRFFGRETSARLTTEAVEMEKKAAPPKAPLLSPEAASAKTPMSLDTRVAHKAHEATVAPALPQVPDTNRRPPAMPAPPTGPTVARTSGTPPPPNWPPKANPLDVNTARPQPVSNPLDSHTTRPTSPSGPPVTGLGVNTGQGVRRDPAGPSGGGPPKMPTGGGSRAFGPSNTDLGGGSRSFGPSSTDIIRNRTSSQGADIKSESRTPSQGVNTGRTGRTPSQGTDVARNTRISSQGTASEAPRSSSGGVDTTPPAATHDSAGRSAFQEFMEDLGWNLFRKNPMVTFTIGLVLLLAIGVTLYMLAPGAKPQAAPTGGLTLVAGHIEVKATSDQSGGFTPATTVTTPDSMIEATQSNGPTVLHFGDASTLRLDEHTLLVFKDWSNHTLTIQLSQGHAFVEPGDGESAEVHAAGAIVVCPAHSGAEFTLSEPNGEPHHPKVKATQGTIVVKTSAGDTSLTAGYTSDLPDAALPTDSGTPGGDASGTSGGSDTPHF